MITLSHGAKRDVAALARDLRRKSRPEATRNLLAALSQAMKEVADDPSGGLGAPRPYPGFAQPGRPWVKVGRYWFAYSLDDQPIITAVFYDATDVPGLNT